MPRQERLNAGIHIHAGREDRAGRPYYRLRYRDRDGKARWAGLGRGTNREINQRAEEFLRGLEGGQEPIPRSRSMTACQAWAWYETDRLADLQKSTRQGYKSIWNKHLAPGIGELPVRQVSTARLREVLDETTAGLGHKTRAHIIEVMKAFFAWCQGKNITSHNPAASISKGRPPAPQKRTITGPRINALMDELDGMDRLLVWLLRVSGLRYGEALALQWQDFQRGGWRESKVYVSRDCVRGVVGPTKTKASERAVPLTPRLRDALMTAWTQRREGDRDFSDSDYVWGNGKGQPMCGDNWRKRVFMPAAKRAHVDFTIKDLRDYAITEWVRAGNMNLLEVQTLAGHSQPQTTAGYFRNEERTTLDKGRKAHERLGW